MSAPARVQLTTDESRSSTVVARMPPPQGAFQQPVTRSPVQQSVTLSPIILTTATNKKRPRRNRGADSSPCPSVDFTATTTETLSGMVGYSGSGSSGSGYSGVSSSITQPDWFVKSDSLFSSVKGIENIGNTCYLAVAVQVFFSFIFGSVVFFSFIIIIFF
jgi:hypothetical protein